MGSADVLVGPLELMPMPAEPTLPAPLASDSVLRRELLDCLARDLAVAEDLRREVAVDAIAGADYFRRVRRAWCRR